MRVIFRADASLDIGTGHVMRSLTLADKLRGRGGKCHFICRAYPGNMIAEIRRRGFEATELAMEPVGNPSVGESDETPLAHAAWLGCDWRVDAEQTLCTLRAMNPDILVIDHYAIDFRWEEVLRPHVGRMMVIDDLADRRHVCDFLLDQNWFGHDMSCRYQELIPDHCVTMLGPQYALLKPEYETLRALMPPRDGEVRRVLVFMGGSDPTNETGKVIDALAQPELANLLLDVVIGVNHPDPRSVVRKAAARPATHVYSGLPSLAGWMARADLMIGAGGSTNWERMCLGLPAVVVTIADNQVQMNHALMAAKYIDLLGSKDEVDRGMIAAAVRRHLAGSAMLREMSIRSQDLVPCTGVDAVCKHLAILER